MQLKKKNEYETVQELYAEYKRRTADHEAEKEKLKQILAEDKKRIEGLNSKLNAVSDISEEEYIATSKALENERLTMEMHDKQLKYLSSTNRGFKSAADKQQFVEKLSEIYRADEAAYIAACAAKLDGINALTEERRERLDQLVEMATETGTLLHASNERQFYMQMLSRHFNMQQAMKKAGGRKD